jgi:hypothetical protein
MALLVHMGSPAVVVLLDTLLAQDMVEEGMELIISVAHLLFFQQEVVEV